MLYRSFYWALRLGLLESCLCSWSKSDTTFMVLADGFKLCFGRYITWLMHPRKSDSKGWAIGKWFRIRICYGSSFLNQMPGILRIVGLILDPSYQSAGFLFSLTQWNTRSRDSSFSSSDHTRRNRCKRVSCHANKDVHWCQTLLLWSPCQMSGWVLRVVEKLTNPTK